MKTPITVRIEADLLEAVRVHARQENRTLTNFIETVLRTKIGASGSVPRSDAISRAKLKRETSDAR